MGNEVATPGGFEPPISTVTGWHVCPLHHGAIPVQDIQALVNDLIKVYQERYTMSS